MPIIAMFLGILIKMQWTEHNPPHFHAEYQDYKAQFDLDGNLLEGHMPRRQQRFIAAWCELHRDELEADWLACRDKEDPFRIEGITRL